MQELTVQFTAQYAGVLSQTESFPYVLFYFDTGIQGDPVKHEFPTSGLSVPTRVTLTGRYDSGKPLPRYTRIVFYATCYKENDYGARCSVDAGFGTMLLCDMLEAGSTKTFSKDISLKLWSCDGYEKGRLRISWAPVLLRRPIEWACPATSLRIAPPQA